MVIRKNLIKNKNWRREIRFIIKNRQIQSNVDMDEYIESM